MRKSAVEVTTPKNLEWLAGASVGRAKSVLPSLLIGQERALSMMDESDETEHQRYIKPMNRKFKKELGDVKIRLGGTNTIDDLKRIWHNERTTPLGKLLGYATILPSNIGASLGRSSHYNPLTNSATVYGNIGSISAHELGHAADFNTVRSGKKSDLWNRTKRDLYTVGRMPEAYLGLRSGPFTHWTEVAANRNVDKALSKHRNKAERRKMKAEAWRRLAPAYSTYGTATALGGLALHHKLSGGGTNTPLMKMVQGTQNILERLGMKGDMARKYAPWAMSIGIVGGGALGGRGIAEIRNWLAGRKHKEEDKPKKKGRSGKEKRSWDRLMGSNSLAKEAAMNTGMGLGMGGMTPWEHAGGFGSHFPMGGFRWGASPAAGAAMAQAHPNPAANAQAPQTARADIDGIQNAFAKISKDENGTPVKEASYGVRKLNAGGTPHYGQRDPATVGRMSNVPSSAAPVKQRASVLPSNRFTQTVSRMAKPMPKTPTPKVPQSPTVEPGTKTKLGGAKTSQKHFLDLLSTFAKSAAQDNSKTQRSATGESEGLSFKENDDDYFTGQKAWGATSKYLKHGGKDKKKEPNPFEGDHSGEEKQALAPTPELRQNFLDASNKYNAARSTQIGSSILGGLSGAGAAAGGLIGAGSGLLNPGEDEEGNQRSRLMQALKRGLGYGAAGAAIGPLAGMAGGLAGGKIGQLQDSRVNELMDQASAAQGDLWKGQTRDTVNSAKNKITDMFGFGKQGNDFGISPPAHPNTVMGSRRSHTTGLLGGLPSMDTLMQKVPGTDPLPPATPPQAVAPQNSFMPASRKAGYIRQNMLKYGPAKAQQMMNRSMQRNPTRGSQIINLKQGEDKQANLLSDVNDAYTSLPAPLTVGGSALWGYGTGEGARRGTENLAKKMNWQRLAKSAGGGRARMLTPVLNAIRAAGIGALPYAFGGGEKDAMDKQAIAAGTLVGGLHGLSNAPEGHTLQNTAHGLGRGIGADVGAGLGAMAGSGAGVLGVEALGGGEFVDKNPLLAALIMGGGTLGGAGLGAFGGWKGVGKLLGKSPAQKHEAGELRKAKQETVRKDMEADRFAKEGEDHGMTPFQAAFFTRCFQNGLQLGQLKEAVDQAHEKFGADASAELYQGLEKTAGLEKLANRGRVVGWLDDAWKWLGRGKDVVQKAGPTAKNIRQTAQNVKPNPWTTASTRLMNQGPVASRVSALTGVTKPVWGRRTWSPTFGGSAGAKWGGGLGAAEGWLGAGPDASLWDRTKRSVTHGLFGAGTGYGMGKFNRSGAGRQFWNAMGGPGGFGRQVGGALTGFNMGEMNNDSILDNLAGAAGGMMFGRYMPAMGRNWQAAGRRAFLGNMTGSVGDQAAGLMGIDTNGRLGQMGGWAGFASPLAKNLRPGAANMPGWAKTTGKYVDDFIEKPWQNMGPKGVWNNLKQVRSNPVLAAGTALGPGMLYTQAAGVPAKAGMEIIGNKVDQYMQDQGAKMMEQKMQEILPNSKDPMGDFRKMAQSAKGMQGLMDNFGNLPDQILGPLFSMFGEGGAEMLAGMNPMVKWMLLLGGGAALGGMFGGGQGAMMGGLGGLALPLMMGAMGGLGGGKATQTAQQQAAPTGATNAYDRSGNPIADPSVPPARQVASAQAMNELKKQQLQQQGKLPMQQAMA
jgi:hypothetical protein